MTWYRELEVVLVHPGAVALVPGLLLLGGGRPSARTGLAAIALPAVAWALLWPEPWTGPRGIASLPAFDLNPWQSLQRAWRLLARDLGITAVPVVLDKMVRHHMADMVVSVFNFLQHSKTPVQP